MCLLNVPPKCRSFIIVHGSNSHILYWIYALLSRNQPCCDYALWEAVLGQNLVGGGTKTFYWTGMLGPTNVISRKVEFLSIDIILHLLHATGAKHDC